MENKDDYINQIDDVLTHLKERLAKLQTLTSELERSTDIGLCVDNSDNRIVNRTSIFGVDFTGVDVNRLPVGIYIEKRADGTFKKVLNK